MHNSDNLQAYNNLTVTIAVDRDKHELAIQNGVSAKKIVWSYDPQVLFHPEKRHR